MHFIYCKMTRIKSFTGLNTEVSLTTIFNNIIFEIFAGYKRNFIDFYKVKYLKKFSTIH